MMHRTTERGQALILIALAAIGLFAFSALAIDGTRTYSDKRHAQNAADTAVLTAALKYVRTGGNFDAAALAARGRATDNGYTNDNVPITSGQKNTKVYVNLCSDKNKIDPVTGWKIAPCDGIDTNHESEYIRVRIVSTIPATFGRVIGRQTITTAAEAIARVKGNVHSSSGSGASGAAMVATNDQDIDQCFLFNGNATLTTHDSGIFVNCGGNEAFYQNGSTIFTMEADSYAVGCNNDKGTMTGGTFHCDAEPMIVDEHTYEYVPTMPAPPTCSGNGTKTHDNSTGKDTLGPGNFSGLTIDNPTVMKPGVYCVSGSFNVNGNNTLDGKPGKVQIVLQNTDFNVGSGKTFTFDDLEIYTVNNDFQVQGTFSANRLRFYSSGTGNSILNAQSSITSPNAYFYLAKGALRWNGGTYLDLHAPPDGDPYVSGVLIHAPWNNEEASNINGGSYARLYGTILMPHSKVTFNGGANFELHGQVIAYEYILDGNGDVEIYYLANPFITPPTVNQAEIQLAE